MNVLICDNTLIKEFWGASELRDYIHRSVAGATVHVRRAPQEDLPSLTKLDEYDVLVLSGSVQSCLELTAWSELLDEWLRAWLSYSKPVLGICYGHQALARVLYGSQVLRKSPNPEYGWTKFQKTHDHPLTQGLSQSFYSFSSHREEVFNLPSECDVFLKSSRCEVQGFQVKEKPFYGIQFHPERTLEGAKESIAGWKKNLKGFKPETPWSKHPYDTRVGDALFQNFFSIIAAG